ncbi:MAG: hypothetical protein JRI23_12385 [Deltaproteobacteria bacterium]|jgi:hypothetical protein|nr:hypothetical protein [Deltaproteobacteria bacterium]MBW2532510.1 hypothetical protein [Deltaproteobacteria bacterium]
MQKIHIRSYMMAETSDIEVTTWHKGEGIDLSSHYQQAVRDRRDGAAGTTLDVFRFDNDRLAWSFSSAGNDVHSAQTVALLLELFVEDSRREAPDPRAL